MTAVDQDTEQRILDAAHAVFLRHGTAGARMQEIADAAGVNKALLHYYFRSKDQLAEAVFRRAALGLLPPMFRILGSDAPLEAKVEQAVEHYLGRLADSPFVPAYILTEIHHHPERITRVIESVTGGAAQGFASRMLETLRGQIEAGVRAGTVRPIAAEQLAVNLMSVCFYPFAAQPLLKVAFGWDQEEFDGFIEERKRVLVEFILSALRP